MLKDPTRNAQDTGVKQTGLREFAWFVGLWAAGVLTVTILGGIIKLVL
ncbi:hypothetical protein [Oceanicaulis alexandrii]|jgi:hypothetical protein|nr:hypothetical protein [Oceanicaulis alexandrii]